MIEKNQEAGQSPDAGNRMLTHKQVWDGIDNLAAKNSLSASALAKRAGLDPTTFNKSKRKTKLGKSRWPSTESISKILEATSTSMREFVELMRSADGSGVAFPSHRLPSIALSEVEEGTGLDPAGFLIGTPEEIEFPGISDAHAYLIELDRDVVPPFYRSGDIVVVAPGSSIRRNDRVVVRLADGGVMFGSLLRRTAQRIQIATLQQPPEEQVFSAKEVSWLARIEWVSQ